VAKIILINPNYYEDIFYKSKVRAAISHGTISLGLLCIAAPLLKKGYKVKILDLNLTNNPSNYLEKEIKEFNPDFAGITATTPLIKKSYQIATAIKEINAQISVLVGGPHPSALPEDVLKESKIDCVVKRRG